MCLILLENFQTLLETSLHKETERHTNTHTRTHKDTAKMRAILIPASLPGVLTHTIPDFGSLMIAAGTHTGKKCNGFVFIS